MECKNLKLTPALISNLKLQLKIYLKISIMVLFIVVVFSKNGYTAENNIKVMLDWTPNTNHTGIIVAQKLGFYAKQGLRVQILLPSKVAVEALVANNYANFGISSSESLVAATINNLPIVSIAAIIAHNTSGFYSLKDKNITSPKDFAGKSYGGWGSTIEVGTVKALVDNMGAKGNRVKITMIGDFNFFKAKNIDFVWGFEGWTGMQAKINKIAVNYISLLKYRKVDDYTPIIITNRDMLKNHSQEVQKFMYATQQGYNYAIKHPIKAAQILTTSYPELDYKLIQASQLYLAHKYQADAPYWGYQQAKVWQNYINWLADNKIISPQTAKSLKVSTMFCNQFVDGKNVPL